METIYQTKFYKRTCHKCEKDIVPINLGVINEMHGYKLNCPECGAFLGWGGKDKTKMSQGEEYEREHSFRGSFKVR
jgi:PHP family Zn ribbon phosphoesterase